MTHTELAKQEEHLLVVLSGKRFLQMEGLRNEVPFFIYPYDPEDALEVAKSKKRIKNRLGNRGIEVFEINLYDLSVEILNRAACGAACLRWNRSRTRATFASCSRGCSIPSSTSHRQSKPGSPSATSTSSS
jgi:hypothetical protein